jgi:hypothetical protein
MSQERAAGIALPPERESAETNEVENLCERLLGDEDGATNQPPRLARNRVKH